MEEAFKLYTLLNMALEIVEDSPRMDSQTKRELERSINVSLVAALRWRAECRTPNLKLVKE